MGKNDDVVNAGSPDITYIAASNRVEKRSKGEEEITATVGRIKLTTFLGQSEKRKRENIRIINSCRSDSELREKMGLLKIWRVEIEEDEEENMVAANGYCGYASMAQIRAQ